MKYCNMIITFRCKENTAHLYCYGNITEERFSGQVQRVILLRNSGVIIRGTTLWGEN